MAQYQHHGRKIVVWLRQQPNGSFLVTMDSEDLFVPEDFETGDVEARGVSANETHQRFNNKVAAADALIWAAGEVEKGIAPKEVEADG